jgi:hypothetical protein
MQAMKILFLASALSMAANFFPAAASAQNFLQGSGGMTAAPTTDAVGRSLNPFAGYASAGLPAANGPTAPNVPALPIVGGGLTNPQPGPGTPASTQQDVPLAPPVVNDGMSSGAQPSLGNINIGTAPSP